MDWQQASTNLLGGEPILCAILLAHYYLVALACRRPPLGMDSAPVVAPRIFPSRPSLGESRPVNGRNNNLSLRMASSTGTMDGKDTRGGGAGGSNFNSLRQRPLDEPRPVNGPNNNLSLRMASSTGTMDTNDARGGGVGGINNFNSLRQPSRPSLGEPRPVNGPPNSLSLRMTSSTGTMGSKDARGGGVGGSGSHNFNSLRQRPLGESRPVSGPSNNLSLQMASSTGAMDTKDARGGGVGGSGSNFNSGLRQRRRSRLIDKGRAAARASPPTTQQPCPPQHHLLRTVSEHKSMDHSRLDRDKSPLSLSADATAETTMNSAETSETSPANSVGVRKVPFTPAMNGVHPPERPVPLPQSILTTTQTFPPQDGQPVSVPVRLASPPKRASRGLAASESRLPSTNLLPRRQRQRSQSLWDEMQQRERRRPGDDDERPRRQKGRAPQNATTKRILPQAPSLSPPSPDEAKRSTSPFKRFSKPKTQSFDEPGGQRSYRAKQSKAVRPSRLKRHSTAPSSTAAPPSNVVDDVLMDRAFVIRQNLMNFEMQELAAEAEKAAESGLERFVGSTSKFGVEETPPYRPKFVDDEDFVANGSGEGGGLLMTPSRRKTLADALTHPMDYTPSYFSRKKIPVTSLRNFSEIVPNFKDIHGNIRHHLTRQGVDVATLPELPSRRSLLKNDTDETLDEGAEEGDAESRAPSVAASHTESISSFSSYAVASLASLKEIIEYVNRPRSPAESGAARAAAASKSNNAIRNNNAPVPKTIEHPSPPRRHTVDFAEDRKRSTDASLPAPHPATHFKPADPVPSDSDDSSVEFYGRRSPIDLNQSASSNASDKAGMNQWRSSLSQTRSNLSAGDHRRRRIGASPSVSFETEKASYQALLDKMHHHASPSVSFDVDQNSCAPSLTNMDIDLLSSSPTGGSTNRSTPMANFLSKIGFSRSESPGHRRSEALDEDNEHFVANFFYTSPSPDGGSVAATPNGGVPTLRLEINPERDHRDPYCLSGCGPNNILSACETATRYADLVFDWFNVKGSNDQPRTSNAILVPRAPSSERDPRPQWMEPWRTNGPARGRGGGRCLFTPPKLSAARAAPREDDLFCSPEAAGAGGECDGAMACPGGREAATCPEIQKGMGCSPE